MVNETTSQTPSWREFVAEKRRQCQQKILREWTLSEDLLRIPSRLLKYDLPRRSGLLSNLELDITDNHTATQLLAKLASGQVSSLAVTTAFCKRAAVAQQLTSCLTETCLPQALNRAQYLDEYLSHEEKPIALLHGLPVSLKDSFCIKGLQPTTADSENNIFGRTLNPHNTSLTAGGSSGGEGALVAFRGYISGVGTDIAG
ncbi:general amidase-B [Aspergillus sclerotialis]|uniref:General amidase-B n=1 Tax=Aspergillus sclerotialis TaxID=2070753 RepID=A0A3A2ZF83_9EURO|nr:general amidase-B [Aspergillus sclerotialis]